MSRESTTAEPPNSALCQSEAAVAPAPASAATSPSESRVWNILLKRPRGIARVPTHSVGRAPERRSHARARLALPLFVQRVAGQRVLTRRSLHTCDISSSGIFFLHPHEIEPGTPIDLEVLLVNRPLGQGAVHMCATAHVVRSEVSSREGWYGLAATFEDIAYRRDDSTPSRRR